MRQLWLLLCAALLTLTVVGHHANGPVWAAPPTSARGSDVVAVSEADNGRSIRLSRGAHVQLVLHSTYWQLTGSSDPSVLAPEGTPQYEAKRNECVPGGGCGTITQSFAAVGSGRADLGAERKVCGEALPCPPDKQRFALTIVVGD